MTRKLRRPVQCVSRIHVREKSSRLSAVISAIKAARPQPHMGAWWFVLPWVAMAVFGGSNTQSVDEDSVGGIAETADGGMVVGVTSSTNFHAFTQRGMVIKTQQDGDLIWRRIFVIRGGNKVGVGGVAESQGGEILVSVRITDVVFSCNPAASGFYLYKLNQNGESIWERKLELPSFLNHVDSGGAPPIFIHSSGGVVLNRGFALAMTDEDANVLWVSTGDFDVVTETSDGDIVAVGNRAGLIVAQRFDIQGNVLWDRELGDAPSPDSRVALSIAESPEMEFLILVPEGVLIELDGVGERVTEREALIVMDGDGDVLEIREHEAFERAKSVIVGRNDDIIILSRIGLIRLDQGGAEVWRNEAGSVRAGSRFSDGTDFVGTQNGDILIANTADGSGHTTDVFVTRTNSDGDIIFSRSFDGEGDGGFVME